MAPSSNGSRRTFLQKVIAGSIPAGALRSNSSQTARGWSRTGEHEKHTMDYIQIDQKEPHVSTNASDHFGDRPLCGTSKPVSPLERGQTL